MTARYQNLVSTRMLAAHCDDVDWVILDCRFDLDAPASGREAYIQGHIPGAVYADLDTDLSGPVSPRSGRHPLPEPADLASVFSGWGIGPGTQVVAYDDSHGTFAARAWWLLRWLGHNHIAVLDGGLSAWKRAGLPMTTAIPQRAPGGFEMRLRNEMSIDAAEIEAQIAAGAIVLDARTAERFMGEFEPLDEKAGHIPGAHNFPYMANLDRHGRFLPPSELRLLFDAALCGESADHVICMCGSGVTACHNILAMEIAGLHGARLYPGSWSEWCHDPDNPVAIGPDT